MRGITLKITGAVLLILLSTSFANGETYSLTQAETGIQKTLNRYCTDCHDNDEPEGGLRLDNFSKLNIDKKFEILNMVEEQVYIRVMPPRKKKKQPTEVERQQLFSMINSWNRLKSTKSKFRQRLKSPEFGNYIDHNELFSGKHKNLKSFTPDRVWLLSEFIFAEKINELIGSTSYEVDGKERRIHGVNLNPRFANPFKLPDTSGVRYYADSELSSSHLMTMLGNATALSEAMFKKAKVSPQYLPTLHGILKEKVKYDEIMAGRISFLKNYIDIICHNIYGDKEQGYLPKFNPAKLSGPVLTKSHKFKGKKEVYKGGGQIPYEWDKLTRLKYFQALDLLKGKTSSDLELLRLIEQHWVGWGLNQTVLDGRLETLRKYIAHLRIEKKRPYVKGYRGYKPLSDKEMNVIIATIKKVRKSGMTYPEISDECRKIWSSEFNKLRSKNSPVSDAMLKKVLNGVYQKMYHRLPEPKEIKDKTEMYHVHKSAVGIDGAIKTVIESLALNPEFFVRNEIGVGKADSHGRKILSPQDASYAISYALTDSAPDSELVKAAKEGRLNTRSDFKREVTRMLKDKSRYTIVDNIADLGKGVDSITNMPIRKLRFFREFFGYQNMLKLFKDVKRFGHDFDSARERIVVEADLLVEHILDEDRQVFEELLTTDKYYYFYSGDHKAMRQNAEKIKAVYEYFSKLDWQKMSSKDLSKHNKILKSKGLNKAVKNEKVLNDLMTFLSDKYKKEPGFSAPYIPVSKFHSSPQARVNKGIKGKDLGMKGNNIKGFYGHKAFPENYTYKQPMKIQHRKGLLTHPAWLQTFSQNTHTDPVTRGKWVREKLLAGTIPDVPIGVEAVIPDDHTKTIRQRFAKVTEEDQKCWKCHQHMNPLGYPFEMYDDFGRYRTNEELESPENIINKKAEFKVIPIKRYKFRYLYKTVPVNSSGVLEGTDDKKLDGKVKDAHDLINRLVKSERVRQSIIRHAFRYFMGRNEMLSDSKTLIDADQAYVKNGGSFDAVIVSLLTSDSFIYRKALKE